MGSRISAVCMDAAVGKCHFSFPASLPLHAVVICVFLFDDAMMLCGIIPTSRCAPSKSGCCMIMTVVLISIIFMTLYSVSRLAVTLC